MNGFLIQGTTYPNASFGFAWTNQDGSAAATLPVYNPQAAG
jgi:hypothetical protein